MVSDVARVNTGIIDVIRQGRRLWFGLVERKDNDDWVSACRHFEVNEVRDKCC